MGEEKFVRAMAFEDGKVGNKAFTLAKFELLTIYFFSFFFWDERLILDQSFFTVRFLPVWYVVQQKCKADMRLSVRFLCNDRDLGRDKLHEVYEFHSRVIHEES